MGLFRLPEVLIVHLKRFSHTQRQYSYYSSTSTQKISENVDYPLEGLDVSPWLWKESHEAAAPPPGFASVNGNSAP